MSVRRPVSGDPHDTSNDVHRERGGGRKRRFTFGENRNRQQHDDGHGEQRERDAAMTPSVEDEALINVRTMRPATTARR